MASTAITALTVQNTLGVSDVVCTDPAIVKSQIDAVLCDIGVDAIKIGMLANTSIIQAVAESLGDVTVPIILDPVMVATSGAMLLEQEAITALTSSLIPMATLLTPNIPEAEALTGKAIHSKDDMEKAAQQLQEMGAKNVLIKGGHARKPAIEDVLLTKKGIDCFSHPRIETSSTHGTGCTLASAIATFLAHGESMEHAVKQAVRYVEAAIQAAPGFGEGNGPLNHLVDYRTKPLRDAS